MAAANPQSARRADPEEFLRRLALNDERVVRAVTGAEPSPGEPPALDARTSALVRLAALLSIGAATTSCRVAVEAARAAGASDEQIVAVLSAIGPAVGEARVVAAAPRLALAIDYDLEAADDAWGNP